MNKKIIVLMVLGMFLLVGCNNNTLEEDKIACHNAGYEYESSGISNTVKCKLGDKGGIISFDYRNLDYTDYHTHTHVHNHGDHHKHKTMEKGHKH